MTTTCSNGLCTIGNAAVGNSVCVSAVPATQGPRSFVETDDIRVTPHDGIASGTGLTRPHAIAEGCSPSCN